MPKITDEPRSRLVYSEYTYEGFKLRDETGRVIWTKETDNTYRVFIDRLKLVNPVRCTSLFFDLSNKKITFKTIFPRMIQVQIQYSDPMKPDITYYIDVSQTVRNNTAYPYFTYIPQELSREQALEKYASLRKAFPKFDCGPDACYNRHGVLIFGPNTTILWASPSDDQRVFYHDLKRGFDGQYQSLISLTTDFYYRIDCNDLDKTQFNGDSVTRISFVPNKMGLASPADANSEAKG